MLNIRKDRMMKEKEKKKSTLGWVMEFAGIDRKAYIFSVLMAIVSVLAGFAPYLFVANIVKALTEGEKELGFYLTQCGFISVY